LSVAAAGSILPLPRMQPPRTTVTRLLREWSAGRREALDELFPLLYGELQRLAARQPRREYCPRSLQTTELLNDAGPEFDRAIALQRTARWRPSGVQTAWSPEPPGRGARRGEAALGPGPLSMEVNTPVGWFPLPVLWQNAVLETDGNWPSGK
jgi:hypothetical protein